MFPKARKPAASDFPQDCILAGEITEECRLADFENLNDVIDPRVLVAAFPKQLNGSLYYFLAQPRLLALAKAGHFGS
jgi:hypothetical protein